MHRYILESLLEILIAIGKHFKGIWTEDKLETALVHSTFQLSAKAQIFID